MVQFEAVWPDNIRVRWRAVTWAEYRQFRALLVSAPLGSSLVIYKQIVVDGPELDNLPAGICAFIAENVMAGNPFSGGYDDVKRSLDACRSYINNSYLLSSKAIIVSTLKYNLEEIDSWDADTFFQRLAMAELILGKPIAEPSKPKKSKSGSVRNLFEQERRQKDKDEDQDEDDLKKKIQKKPLTPTQAKAIERIKQARREQGGR